MLSRTAQGLYWMTRYLERAEHTCRLLGDQLEALENRSVEEIDRSWRRLYRALGRSPKVGGIEPSMGDEAMMLADAYTLFDDLTFERYNTDSVRSCIAAARENARWVRNAFGGGMWTCLNTAYLSMRDTQIEDIWRDRPGEFYHRIGDALQSFAGRAESAVYRDHGWHFLQLGRFVERAQLVAALVEAQLALSPTDRPHAEPEWDSLLRVCNAYEAYRRLYSLEYRPASVVDFLVADRRLSHSIRYALARVAEELAGAAARREPPRAVEAARHVGRMAARLDYDWPQRDPRADAAARVDIAEIRGTCRLVHSDIERAYFDYEIEDAPPS